MSGKLTFSGIGTGVVAVLFFFLGAVAGWKVGMTGQSSRLIAARDTIIIHDTIPGDSIPYLVIKYYPKWDTVVVPSVHSIPARVDTAAILDQFFSHYYYSDTITDDTSFLAIINDDVSCNKIQSREYWHRNMRPRVINTIIMPEKKPLPFAAGAYLGYGQKLGIGIQGMYLLPDSRKTITGSIGTDGVRVGIMWQIRGTP